MKPVVFTRHAREQMAERGATEDETVQSIREGQREPARQARSLYRFNFAYNKLWGGTVYAVKQVAPLVVEETNRLVVITVFTFYF